MAGIEQYLSSADIHNYSNGQGSVEDSSSWISDSAKFTMSALTRGVTSAFNTIPGTVNLFGGNLGYLETDAVLSAFDDDLGAYYRANKDSVDKVGDIVGALVPGIAAVKVLNYGQRALSLLAAGRPGLSMARSIGTLPTLADTYAAKAVSSLGTNTYTKINADVVKSFAAGYAQSALEGAAFLTAAGVTMKDYSPLFDEQTPKDIAINALYGGGAVGAGIFGTVTAAQTYFKLKKAAKALDIASKPATLITETVQGTSPAVSAMVRLADQETLQANIASGKITPEFLQKAKQTSDRLNVALREDITKLGVVDDSELGGLFHAAVKGMDTNTSLAVFPDMVGIGRISSPVESVLSKKAASGLSLGIPSKNYSVKYASLLGEDAGNITNTAPEVTYLGDTLASSKAVENEVYSYKFGNLAEGIKGVKPYSVLGEGTKVITHSEIEARMIWAQQFKAKDFSLPGAVIGAEDIPLLQRALFSGAKEVKITYPGAPGVEYTLSPLELAKHLKQTKMDVANSLSSKYPTLNTATVAKMVDVRKSYLEGAVDPQNEIKDIYASYDLTADQLLQPRTAKIAYEVKPGQVQNPAGFTAAATYIKQVQNMQQQAVDNVFNNFMDSPFFSSPKSSLFERKLSDSQIYAVTREDAGAGIATAASGGYGTTGSIVENIGKSTHTALEEVTVNVSDVFAGSVNSVKSNPAAAAEIIQLQHLVRSNAPIFEYDSALGNVIDKSLPASSQNKVALNLKTLEAQEFMSSWMNHNANYLSHRQNLLAVSGIESNDLSKLIYFPGPDPKKYTHHAFVVDNSVTSTGHTSMIWAKSAEELAAKAAKVPPELNVYFKKDLNDYHTAFNSYNYQLGINENYINTALLRKGVASELNANPDIGEVMQEFMAYRMQADRSLVRDMVSLKYSKFFRELSNLGDEFTAIGTSKATSLSLRKHAEEEVQNPYMDVVKTALDITKNNEIPLWTTFNRTAENTFSKLYGAVQSIWSKSSASEEARIAEVSSKLEQAGVSSAYRDAAYSIYENHPAGKGPLSKFIATGNSVLTTTILRTDPMNALNNGIGAQVLLWDATREIVNGIKASSFDAAGELSKLAKLKVPGGGGAEILSPSKLVSGAYVNFFKSLAGSTEHEGLLQFYKDQGWIPTLFEQYKSALDTLSLTGVETVSVLGQKTKDLVKFAERWSGNNFAEEMNRFVAANVAHQITELGVKHGVMDSNQALSYINTFVNRTQGNMLASQRPLLFQGPVGKAISLFQTYQFNMLQTIFRHVGEGKNKQLGYLLGLQGTVYGASGLPGFNAINQYLVGNAEGNVSHSDLVSTTFDTAGHEAAQWLLYGASSNFLLTPDLKTNLYTRGDINPRQVTIVPVHPADVPLIGATTSLVSSLLGVAKKAIDGADLSEAFLQGIEHSQISRPLAGLAVVAQGHSTSTKGNIMAENDLYSLATLSRLAGARPLDEAIARDSYYRIQAYEGAMHSKMNTLGEALRTKITSGAGIEQGEVTGFMDQYVHAGGDQKNFIKWYQHQVKQASSSQIQQLLAHTNTPYSKYMQKIIGGSDSTVEGGN